jgi:uncharacterized phage protein (TIGR02218 family)
MKAISDELKAHLALPLTTIATCWQIVRTDNVAFFFTDHDTDIQVGINLYKATTGMITTQTEMMRTLGADNIQAVTVLDDASITQEDLESGKFDNAIVDIFIVNYEDLSMGVMYLAQEWNWGKVSLQDHTAGVEMLSKSSRLDLSIVELTSKECRAAFGDARCGIDLDASGKNYVQAGTVGTVTDNRHFTVSGLDCPSGEQAFDYGKITWEGGSADDGLSMEIKSFDDQTGAMVLFDEMPFAVVPGDTFEATYGCDKSLATCHRRYANDVNFRGEPWVPISSSKHDEPTRARRAWRR